MSESLEMNREAAPVAPEERVLSIDVLRGAALVGVLLVNLLNDFRISLAADILGSKEPLGWGGGVVLQVVRSQIEFKALTLFSFLFGVGVAIQAGRVSGQARGWFLVRRFGALLAIGIVHMLFIWNGDILALYGVCGLLLIPLLGLPEYALVVLGLGLIVWPNVAPYPVPFPATATLKSLAAGAVHAYGHGTWPELLAFRWRETQLLIVPLLALSLPRTLGLMLWGAAAWRKGWMIANTRLWRWAALAGAGMGIAGEWLGIDEAANVGLAMAYGAGLLLWSPRARRLAPVGRMALTNYLMESVIFGFVFYGYGLGQFGRIGVVATLIGGLAVYGLQLAFSEWWLRRFCFGPVEWLWRCVSYLRWPPFACGDGLTVSRVAAQVSLAARQSPGCSMAHLPHTRHSPNRRWQTQLDRPRPTHSRGQDCTPRGHVATEKDAAHIEA